MGHSESAGSVKIVEIGTWAEAIENICRFPYSPVWDRHKVINVYRGLNCWNYPLANALLRTYPLKYIPDLEKVLIRNFMKYAHDMVSQPDMSYWQWLSLARHYGLPTRLLDWTFSPLVALYFATRAEEKFDVDGIVWCLNIEGLITAMPERLRVVLEQNLAKVFSVRLLEHLDPRDFFELTSVGNRIEEPITILFEPPSLDQRIINQHACFTIISDATASLDIWLDQHPGIATKYIIKAAAKREIADSLDACNINPRVLFPGLQGLAETLKRRYGPWSAYYKTAMPLPSSWNELDQ